MMYLVFLAGGVSSVSLMTFRTTVTGRCDIGSSLISGLPNDWFKIRGAVLTWMTFWDEPDDEAPELRTRTT